MFKYVQLNMKHLLYHIQMQCHDKILTINVTLFTCYIKII